jgi:flagellar protein FliO/FliZ
MKLFGGMPDAGRFIVAFLLLVLGLIGAGAFLWRRFGAGPRGRQPRLAVIDATAVDGRRRLVLVRLDNTEHLLMIGGPTDILIESNIARAAANPAMREARPGPVAEIPARPAVDGQGWPQPFETMPRAVRPIEPPRYPPAPAGEGRDGLRPEPTPRLPREPMPVEPAARTTRTEPGVRLAPPGSAERFRPDFDNDEVTAPALTPEPAHHAAPEPRRAPVQPIPPPPSYEPVFQTAPAPERRPPAPAVPPAADEPPFQRATEPRRAPVRPAPPPPAYEPVFQSAAMPEPHWTQAPPTPASAQESGHQSGHQSGYHSPVFQSTVITESKRAQMVPPRPSQTDENNFAELAQRLEAALRPPIKPVEPAPPPMSPRAAAPAEPVANAGARVAAYFDTPAPPVSAPAARAQEAAPASTGKT